MTPLQAKILELSFQEPFVYTPEVDELINNFDTILADAEMPVLSAAWMLTIKKEGAILRQKNNYKIVGVPQE